MPETTPTLETVLYHIKELRIYLEQRLDGIETAMMDLSAKMDLIREDIRKLRSDYAELTETHEQTDDDTPMGPVN